MNVNEAIAAIRNPESSFELCVEAAGALADSPETPLAYLVECLKRGGLPAEFAAMKLYKRTGRPGPKSIRDFSMDPADWTEYVKQTKL